MSFDFFNTSHLAFGSKLTRAFRLLESIASDAEEHISNLEPVFEYYRQYVSRNYRVLVPQGETNAVQAEQLYDLINDDIIIKELKYESNSLSVALYRINRNTDRITAATGTTNLREGYAYFKPSVSNSNFESSIEFKEAETTGAGELAFKFRIDSQNKINIDLSKDCVFTVIPKDAGNLESVSLEYIGRTNYTATDYEAILVVGNVPAIGFGAYGGLLVKVNGETVLSNLNKTYAPYSCIYLKPGDTLYANCNSSVGALIYRVKYE